MDERDVLATHFAAYRTRLQAVAYRRLGSTSEAAHSHLLRLAVCRREAGSPSRVWWYSRKHE